MPKLFSEQTFEFINFWNVRFRATINFSTKYLIISFLALYSFTAKSQSLQLHYDLRHTIDPDRNPKIIQPLTSNITRHLIPAGHLSSLVHFYLKRRQTSQVNERIWANTFMQVSQELQFWRPKVFLNLQYSGGLGITTPRQYSYYITNTYLIGLSYHYKIGSAFLSSVLFYKSIPYARTSNDFLFNSYFYQGLWNYKADIEGDFSLWTENKNHGDALTEGLEGKRFFFFAQPPF